MIIWCYGIRANLHLPHSVRYRKTHISLFPNPIINAINVSTLKPISINILLHIPTGLTDKTHKFREIMMGVHFSVRYYISNSVRYFIRFLQ